MSSSPAQKPRTPPHDLDAEATLLGCLMLGDRDAVSGTAALLRPEDIYAAEHRDIYEAILALWDHGKPTDAVAVLGELRRRSSSVDPLRLHEIAQGGTTASAAPHYADTIRELAQLRRLIAIASEIIESAYQIPDATDEFVSRASALLGNVVRERPRSEAVLLVDASRDAIADLEAARAQGLLGLGTGFSELDRTLGGLQDGWFVVVAARPGLGKTALAANVARHVAGEGHSTAFFSLEMSRNELALRMMCSEAGLSSHRLRQIHYAMAAQDWQSLVWAEDRFSELPLRLIDSEVSTIAQLRQRARRLASSVGLRFVVVDYLQLMVGSGKADRREQEVAEISRGLKLLAKELQLPVLACAQLNREIEHRADPKPKLSDLRDSGQIEQDADVVMFLHPHSKDPDEQLVDVMVSKHRHGPQGSVTLRFDAPATRFRSLAA